MFAENRHGAGAAEFKPVLTEGRWRAVSLDFVLMLPVFLHLIRCDLLPQLGYRAFADRRGHLIMSLSRSRTLSTLSLHYCMINNMVKTLYIWWTRLIDSSYSFGLLPTVTFMALWPAFCQFHLPVMFWQLCNFCTHCQSVMSELWRCWLGDMKDVSLAYKNCRCDNTQNFTFLWPA